MQNSKEEKPRRVVADDWMVRERKRAAKKQTQDAVIADSGNVSGAEYQNGSSAAGMKVMNGTGNGVGIGNANGTTSKTRNAASPPAKNNTKNPSNKNPTTGKKDPKNKTPKGKPGVKGRGQTGAKVLDKEDAVVEDLLVDFEG